MPQKKEMIGKRFGRLIAQKEVGKGSHGYRYLFSCDCGNEIEINGGDVRSGHTLSCGCLRSERMSNKNFKHGKCDTPQYRSMQARTSSMKRKLRMPKWANIQTIKQFYMNKPAGCHVDHIIPLQGKFVSGLHVENNLQYLSEEENRRKANFYPITE